MRAIGIIPPSPFGVFIRQSRRSETVLFFDTFTDTNGTDVITTPHIPDIDSVGNGWLRTGGVWTINNNEVTKNIGGGTGRQLYADCGSADCTITCDVTISTSGNVDLPGVAFRLTDTNNFWKVILNRVSNFFTIIERNGGSDVTRANLTGVTITAGVTFAVRVILSGQSITATLDGANQISYGLASLNETVQNHGLQSQSDDTYDNFKVIA